MQITFLGGADEVGASSVLITIAGKRLLVDAGIRPSPKARWGLAGDQLPHLELLAQGGVDAVLVTHAHTDHTGALEQVIERFPTVPVYASGPTIALTRILHADSQRIMSSRYEEEGELPLHDGVAVSRLLGAMIEVPLRGRVPLSPNLSATYYHAGHIAGAAMIRLDSDEGSVLISGDISVDPQRTVDPVELPRFQPDVLIVESTYGNRMHANRVAQERALRETVGRVVAAGGKVLIPAFALGRAQEVLLLLSEARKHGALLDNLTVYADGMVRSICAAYRGFGPFLPKRLREQLDAENVRDGAPFFDDHIRPIQSQQHRQEVIWSDEPCVIVASSGMLAGGASLAYAKALAGKPVNALLLTGYQDEESPGRRLQQIAEAGRGTLNLNGDKVDVQCQLATYSLSAHADSSQILSLVEALQPKRTLLVHGDRDARLHLMQALKQRGRWVGLPRAGESFDFAFDRRSVPTGLGDGRPLDLKALWTEVGGIGGIFRLDELAAAWWGDDAAGQTAALLSAIDADGVYFVRHGKSAERVRARSALEIDTAQKRAEQIARLGHLEGHWIAVRTAHGERRVLRVERMAVDCLWAREQPEDEPERIYPELVAQVFDPSEQPPELSLTMAGDAGSQPATAMEQNQALAFVRQALPCEARLRKIGYRLETQTLILSFQFPDVARERFAVEIGALERQTGWHIEVDPQANQLLLGTMAREAVPDGWCVQKGPSLYTDAKRVEVTIAPAAGRSAGEPDAAVIESAQRIFAEQTGWTLRLVFPKTQIPARPAPAASNVPRPGQRLEMNAALDLVRTALEGSSLYKAGLKGNTIVLNFISPQVGARFADQIAALEQQIGYQLSIYQQPNQLAILDHARALIEEAGWIVRKGPSIFVVDALVTATLDRQPPADRVAAVSQAFEQFTGYRLALAWPEQEARVTAGAPRPATPVRRPLPPGAVEIPVKSVRLSAWQSRSTLDAAKLARATDRAARMGIAPPIQVRQSGTGYILIDGLYRLRAATDLGLATIPAVVKEPQTAGSGE